MSRVKVDWRSYGKKEFKSFCLRFPQVKLTYTEWVNIQSTYGEIFKTHILETGEKAKLPNGMGHLSIVKKKRKIKKGRNDEFMNLPIDWKRTKEVGKRIYQMNYHTEGFFFGWQWFGKRARNTQPSLWFFKSTRVTSRILAHYLKIDSKYMNIYQEWNLKA